MRANGIAVKAINVMWAVAAWVAMFGFLFSISAKGAEPTFTAFTAPAPDFDAFPAPAPAIVVPAPTYYSPPAFAPTYFAPPVYYTLPSYYGSPCPGGRCPLPR